MGIESRASARVRMDATLKVEIDLEMKENVRIIREPQKAEIVDISTVGVGAVAPIFFPKGVLLTIDMDASAFKTEKPFRISGEVRYCRPTKEGKYRLGIKFVDLDSSLASKIKEYVEANKDKAV